VPSHLILAAIFALALTFPDETLRRYGGANNDWHLVTLNGVPFNSSASIAFPARHQIAGQGPCNRFSTSNTKPYPWIEIGPIAATRRACPDLDTEAAYFESLRAATIAIIENDTLTLSDEDKTLLVFKARD